MEYPNNTFGAFYRAMDREYLVYIEAIDGYNTDLGFKYTMYKGADKFREEAIPSIVPTQQIAYALLALAPSIYKTVQSYDSSKSILY